MKHRARKRFGQHFLTSSETVAQIVAAIAPRAGECIVEIGPGQAAITKPLAASGATLHAIEFDRDLVGSLHARYASNHHVTIHEADALDFDFSNLGEDLRIVGNLPYNISTPLLFHLLTYKDCIRDAHFMLQKEIVERMSAVHGSKSFGRLSIMLGCRMEVVPLFDVPPTAFAPPPRVTSSVVRMRPLPETAYDIHNPALLEKIVKTAFSRRRKTIQNALRGMVDAADFEAAGIAAGDRPEQISVSNWVRLTNLLNTTHSVDN